MPRKPCQHLDAAVLAEREACAQLSWRSFNALMLAALDLPKDTQGRRRVLQEAAALRAAAIRERTKP